MSKLTVKQEAAIQNFLINGGNKTAAYKSAYSTSKMKAKTINEKASRFFADDKVRARLQELQKETEENNKITRDWVLEQAKKLVDRSLDPEAIFTKKGEFTGEFRFDSSGVKGGLEIINKMLGYNEPDKSETVVSETKTLPDWYKPKC